MQGQPTQNFDDGLSDYPQNATYEEKEKEFLKEILDVSRTLLIFEQRVLRGKYRVVNEETGKNEWVELVPDHKLMNELGVREIMAVLSAKITTEAKMTYKEEEEIYTEMFFADMSLSELFAKRCSNWEMDIEVMKSIKDACISLMWDSVTSARNGFTAINLRSQYMKQDVSRSDTSTNQKSGGFLSNLLGRSK
jgi:hypothetical protein